MATPTKTPYPGVLKFTILADLSFGHHFSTLSLFEQCPRGEEILRNTSILHFLPLIYPPPWCWGHGIYKMLTDDARRRTSTYSNRSPK